MTELAGVEPETVLLHFDLDAYFASVEAALRPELAGKALAVGGTGPGGIVTSANYRARADGVRAAMPVSRARTLSPGLVVVAPRLAAYRRVSAEVAKIAGHYGEVRMTSPDEGTVTAGDPPTSARWAWAHEQALALRDEIARRLGLSCSVGVGAGATVAKIASELAKPGGVVVCDDPATMLAPLGIEQLPGVGPVSAQILARAGICTVEDARRAGPDHLARLLGTRHGAAVALVAVGGDPPPPLRPSRQVGSEHTFDLVIGDPGRVVEFVRQAGGAAYRRSKGAAVAAVTVKLRGQSRSEVTKSRVLQPPTRDRAWLRQIIEHQADLAWSALGEPVRLIGVTFELSDLPDQPALLTLGPELQIPEPLEPTLAEIAWANMPIEHPLFGVGVLIDAGPEGWRVRFEDGGVKVFAFDAPLRERRGRGTG